MRSYDGVQYAKTTIEVAELWESNAEIWTQFARAGFDTYRDHHNTPAFMAILPEIKGLKGLDIGCGEGSNTRKLAEAGAEIVAVDLAPTFIRHAEESEKKAPLGIRYSVADAARLPFEDASFDFATAFMSLMDIANQAASIGEAYRVIRNGGFFQFSILHPCFAPPCRKTLRDETGSVYAIEIADYFIENDGSIEEWTFGAAKKAGVPVPALFKVPRFHRTLSSWISLLIDTGFQIDRLNEPMASTEEAEKWPEIADTRVTPMFLHIRVIKT